MRLVVFDPFRGAAGDMITAALLDLGADREMVTRAMRSLVEEPEINEVNRAGIRALFIDTRADIVPRSLDEVLERVLAADAPAPAVEMAGRVFMRISSAEEEVHGKTPHFHEVGADDAIAEVVGACTALFSLRPDGCAVMPVALGGGSVSSLHGLYPVPAPATLAILRSSCLEVIPGSGNEGELCTPTGAALLAEFGSRSPGPRGIEKIISVGYGAGSRDSPGIPNVLRVTLVETRDAPQSDQVDILETNVDDVSGEFIASALTRVMREGARDASAIPCMMKKGRPAYLIRVICSPDKSATLAESLAMELGTLGIRCIPAVHRFLAGRSEVGITVTIGGKTRTIGVKYGMMHGHIFSVKAEFEEINQWAGELGISPRELARVVEEAAYRTLGKAE